MNTQIVVAEPRQSTSVMLRQANQILYLKRLMRKDVHYGAPYPGSKKETLLKPGAEWLARRFGLRPRYEILKETLNIDWEHPERSLIIYETRCVMVDIETGAEVGEAIGACTSLEDKYRYRTARRICPSCGKETIMENRPDKGPGFYCWKKLDQDACGKNFPANAPEYNALKNQEAGKTVNTNPFNELNTILKMSQKRSFVSGVLVATGASPYFAPGDDEVKDLYAVAPDDENVIDAEFEDVETPDEFPIDEPQRQQQQKPGPQKPQSKPEEKPAPHVPQQPQAIDVPAFVDWAFKVHMMSESETLKALEASVNYNVPTIDAFKEGRVFAMAAVICAKFNYDPTAIEKYTLSIPIKENAIDYRFELWQDAQKIILLNQPPAATTPASTPSTGWTGEQHEEIYNYLFTYFRWDKDSALELLGKNDWSEFGTVEKAKEAIRAQVAQSQSVMMVATGWQKRDGYDQLNTIFPTRLYGHDLVRALGDEWVTLADEVMKAGAKDAKGTFPRPLLVTWKQGGKGNNSYYQVTDLMVLTEDDDDWSADDPKAP
jgi:hypothetical protein